MRVRRSPPYARIASLWVAVSVRYYLSAALDAVGDSEFPLPVVSPPDIVLLAIKPQRASVMSLLTSGT